MSGSRWPILVTQCLGPKKQYTTTDDFKAYIRHELEKHLNCTESFYFEPLKLLTLKGKKGLKLK